MKKHNLNAIIAEGFVKLPAGPVEYFTLTGVERLARRENVCVDDISVFRLTDGLWHFFKRPNSAPFSQTALMS